MRRLYTDVQHFFFQKNITKHDKYVRKTLNNNQTWTCMYYKERCFSLLIIALGSICETFDLSSQILKLAYGSWLSCFLPLQNLNSLKVTTALMKWTVNTTMFFSLKRNSFPDGHHLKRKERGMKYWALQCCCTFQVLFKQFWVDWLIECPRGKLETCARYQFSLKERKCHKDVKSKSPRKEWNLKVCADKFLSGLVKFEKLTMTLLYSL